MAMRLYRDDAPPATSTDVLGMRNSLAISLHTALFALPSAGGAALRTFFETDDFIAARLRRHVHVDVNRSGHVLDSAVIAL